MVLNIFGGRLDAPPPPGGWRWLLQSRPAGTESPVPCSYPNLADGRRLHKHLCLFILLLKSLNVHRAALCPVPALVRILKRGRTEGLQHNRPRHISGDFRNVTWSRMEKCFNHARCKFQALGCNRQCL